MWRKLLLLRIYIRPKTQIIIAEMNDQDAAVSDEGERPPPCELRLEEDITAVQAAVLH